jgi:hypothetical protein
VSGIQDLKPNHPWAGFRNVAKVLERPKRLYWVLLLTGMIEHPEPFLPPPTFLSSGNQAQQSSVVGAKGLLSRIIGGE